MNKGISDSERVIFLCIFVGLIFIYTITGFYKSNVSPILKLMPFIIMSLYAYLKPKLKNKH